MDGHNHYIRLEGNKVIKGFSDAFEEPQEGDILIAENAGRHFELDGVVNPPLADEQGVALYKYEKGKAIKRTQAEIDADIELIPASVPDELTLLRAELEATKDILVEKKLITESEKDGLKMPKEPKVPKASAVTPKKKKGK